MHQMGRKRPVFHRDGFNRPIRGIPHIFAVVGQHHDGAHIGAATPKPILVQASVHQATAAEKRRASLGAPIPENPYALPDFMADAAVALRAAGAQFLRACGEATPAYTGALAAGVFGADSIR